jgi:flagellar assembly protein FliH
MEATIMIRRLWRDVPLLEGRVRLGESGEEPTTESQPDATSKSTSDDAPLMHELQLARTRISELEHVLEASRHESQQRSTQLTQIESRLDAERAAACDRGYAEGMEKAAAAARLEAEHQARQWQRSAEEMLRAHENRWQAMRNDLTDVVMGAVIKMLGEQLAHPQAIRAAIEQTMRESSVGAPLRVLIAPSQYDQLTKAGGSHLGWFKERRMELAPDVRVAHGGCLLETTAGYIDARFETQLARLREIIANHYTAARTPVQAAS